MRHGHLPELLAGAHRVLAAHRLHGLTVPHPRLFPGGYLWDTAVIAKGIAVDDPRRAGAEVTRYLQAQWSSGMLPNEVYFEGRASRRRLFGDHPDRPQGLTTSGITQPPMIVRAALEVGRRLDRRDRDEFLEAVFPPLRRLCDWVLARRVGRNGLAVVIHPYETGMDNRLDLSRAMSAEWGARGGPVRELRRSAAYLALAAARRLGGDHRHVPARQRSGHHDVLDAALQTAYLRRHGYDLAAVEAGGHGLLVEDVGYNAVLVDAFGCLEELAADLGRPGDPRLTVPAPMSAAMHRVGERLEDLWAADPAGLADGYRSRDYRTGRLLPEPTVAGLFPLLVTRDRRRADVLVRDLTDPSRYWTRVTPPSAPVDSPGFDPVRYWQGPAWCFPTDILETALTRQGRHDVAGELRRRYLSRPHGDRHAEYENPLTGDPLGVAPFSPAAALAIRFADVESAVRGRVSTPGRLS